MICACPESSRTIAHLRVWAGELGLGTPREHIRSGECCKANSVGTQVEWPDEIFRRRTLSAALFVKRPRIQLTRG
jgi:hypothetical protein